MNDKELELTDLDLEDILKEFGDVQDSESVTEETADETQEERMEELPAQEQTEQPAVPGDTIRLDDLAQVNRPENTVKNAVVTAETVRLYPIMLEATEEAAWTWRCSATRWTTAGIRCATTAICAPFRKSVPSKRSFHRWKL